VFTTRTAWYRRYLAKERTPQAGYRREHSLGGGFVPRSVACEIEFLRRRLGLSQLQLSRMIGLSQGHISNFLLEHDPISSFSLNDCAICCSVIEQRLLAGDKALLNCLYSFHFSRASRHKRPAP
jgi:hypothetical protein